VSTSFTIRAAGKILAQPVHFGGRNYIRAALARMSRNDVVLRDDDRLCASKERLVVDNTK
jgi:hypothetical protein